MNYEQAIETGLASANPTEDLRKLSIDMSSGGLRRSEIYRIFLRHYKTLQDSGRSHEEDILGDVMDMVTNTYAGHYLNLPD